MKQASSGEGFAPAASKLLAHIRADVDRALVGATDEEAESFTELNDRLATLTPDAAAPTGSHDLALDWLPAAEQFAPASHRSMLRAVIDLAPHLTWLTPYESVEGSPQLDHFRSNYTSAPLTDACLRNVSAPLGGPGSTQVALFLTVQGADVVYPAHHHPAVEIYGIIAGAADWLRGGEGFRPRRPGDVFLHSSETVHATTTRSEPVVTWVAWLDRFETPPELS